MSLYRIALNPNRCIGCKACLVHCNIKNKLPAGLSLNRLKALGPFTGPDGRPRMEFVYQNCMQCDDPFCVKVCPSGACEAFRNYSINAEKCIGCGLCARKCPVGAISGEKKEPHTIDVDKCIKCGACYDACRFNAVEI